ncbi:MAG TPA: DUF6498-containing protein [Kiritimatiellia bacterium]|nr:DUF6498-containing protein [Kiritimatiellia bacterium]
MNLPILTRILVLLGLNSIPALGWFGVGWSEGTLLAVYWCESIMLVALVSARIVLHRTKTRTAGHWRVHTQLMDKHGKPVAPPKPGPNRFLASYVGVMIPFLLVQGLVLGGLLVMLPGMDGMADTAVNRHDVLRGVIGMAGFLVLGFLMDIPRIGEKPFAWIRTMSQHAQGRLLVFQFSILIGLPLMSFTDQPRLFFSVFVILKTWLDFSIYLPSLEPKEAPKWLCRLMDKIPGPAGAETRPGGFAAFWRRDIAEQQELAALDERRMEVDAEASP